MSSKVVSSQEAAAAAINLGLCGEIAPNGFVCTRGRNHPHGEHDEHRAMAIGGPEDGHIYEVWPT